jgi:hypothetical protein
MPFIPGHSTPEAVRAKGIELQEKIAELCEGAPLQSVAYAIHWMLCGEPELQLAVARVAEQCEVNRSHDTEPRNVFPIRRDPEAN